MATPPAVKLLVVDDDPKIRWVLKQGLGDDNFNIIEAEDGQNAIEQFEKSSPELILMDVKMPGMDGLEAMRQIKDRDDGVPIVILSAYPDAKIIVQAMKLGALDFLIKPFDIDMVKKNDSDNPVYYVQYAHARICSIFRKAESEGVDINIEGIEDELEMLILDEEIDLIRFLIEFPGLLDNICRSFEAHRLTYYLTELAAQFHKYFNLGTKKAENRIISSDHRLTRARLALADSIRIVIRNGLNLLGVGSPEKM